MNQYLYTLGLQPGVTEADIKKAYRRLAKLYHPDVNKDPDAQRRFVEITEAYNFLLEVGAKPHEEPVTYAYDAHAREYAERRRRARAYAREKQRQAAEEKWRTLYILYKYSDYLVGVFLLTNALFLLDYLLPSIPQEEKIVKITLSYESENHYGQTLIYRHSVVQFESHSMLIDRKVTDEWHGVDSLAYLYTTPLLGTVVRADIVLNAQSLALHPVFSIYDFFFFLIPAIIIFGILYFRWPKTSDNKIGVVIILLVLFVIQMLVFFTGK